MSTKTTETIVTEQVTTDEIIKTPEQIKQEEKSLERKAALQEKDVLKQLEEMPKKSLFISVDDRNPQDTHVWIGFNGIAYAVKRGEEVEVPSAIYDIYRYSEAETRKANNRVKTTEIQGM